MGSSPSSNKKKEDRETGAASLAVSPDTLSLDDFLNNELTTEEESPLDDTRGPFPLTETDPPRLMHPHWARMMMLPDDALASMVRQESGRLGENYPERMTGIRPDDTRSQAEEVRAYAQSMWDSSMGERMLRTLMQMSNSPNHPDGVSFYLARMVVLVYLTQLIMSVGEEELVRR